MTFISLIVALALQSVSPDPLEAAYGNTLVSTYPDGRTARLWLSRDHTYSGQGRSGRPSAGVWEIRGSELCMRQRRPIPLPVRYCTAIVTGGVGTQWKAKAVTGEPITVMLVAGR